MKIVESSAPTSILLSKSTRDLVMSEKIPKDCGLSNSPFTMYIVGKPGSGKTHFLESIMKKQLQINPGKDKQTCFSSIYVIAPESSKDSYEDSFIEDCNEEKVYTELTYENLAEVVADAKVVKEEAEDEDEKAFSLLIIDDCATELRNKHVQKLLLRILRNYRHLHLSVIVVSQNYMAVAKDCRDNLQQLVQFNTTNKKEKERLNVEWFGQFSPNEFEALWGYLFDKEPYQFVMGNRRTDEIYKTFKKLEITK